MKQKILILTLLFAATAESNAATPRTRHNYKTKSDSSLNVTKQADRAAAESGTTASFFNGVIPPTPQAAALARYAEYPVSHTTGIPDITIPLYEIKLGEFTLPVTVSYHASGARIDDIPTSVGSGWTLNAGGAVTRTILGAPDLETDCAADYNYSYYDLENVRGLLGTNGKGFNSGVLNGILERNPSYDTESDRYTFNTGSYTGIFRYSHSKGEYVILDQSSCNVYSTDYGMDSRFLILCPDNTEFIYSVQEKSGVDPDLEEPRHATAWYPESVITPWGDVTFTYIENGQFFIKRKTSRWRSGYYPKSEWDIINVSHVTHYYFEVKHKEFPEQSIYFRPKLLKTIQWNGNRIEFEYEPWKEGDRIRRLASMKVISSSGETVKTVIFRNDVPWTSAGERRGWRMLRSIEDSEDGIYEFTYDMSAFLPPASDGSDPAERSDSWGFYNGTSGSVMSRIQADWLLLGPDSLKKTPEHSSLKYRDRNPSLSHTMLGVLTGVRFPTGSRTRFTYGLNEHEGKKFGGLRVESVTTGEGSEAVVKHFSYGKSVLPQLPPDSLARHFSYQYIFNTSTWDLRTLQYKDVESSGIMSAFRQSAPVIYTEVSEVLSDGTTTSFRYDPLDMAVDTTMSDWRHPSIFETALNDKGAGTPVLVSRTVKDGDGTLLFKESTSWKCVDLEEFVTGVRVTSVFNYYECSIDNEGDEAGGQISAEGIRPDHLLVRETKAVRRVAVPETLTTEEPSTGYSSSVTYAYDPLFRTVHPVSESRLNSDGKRIVTLHEYPFDRNDSIGNEMMEMGYCDWPLSETTMSGVRTVAKKEYEYGLVDGWLYKFATRSWSAPTGDGVSSPPSVLPERERVSGYNSLGRPLSVTVEETDVTTFGWNSTGDLLLSATAPGGLTTSYTHRPLFGVASVTLPNGHKSDFTYNAAGMLASVSDNLGVTDRYGYSIANHSVTSMTGCGNSVTSTRLLDASGNASVVSRQYHDGLGRPSLLVAGGANTSGNCLYSLTEYDSRGREWRKTLPMAGGTSIEEKTAAEVLSLGTSTYGDSHAYSETLYDGLDRPVSSSTPGQAWFNAGKVRSTEYVSNSANSVRYYFAPMNAITLSEDGYYPAGTLQGVRSVDEEGNEMTVYADRLGRKVLERRGPESGKGQNDTYFVNNDLGQLRYVLSPGYELSGYKERFAYEYRYDWRGNVVKKFIPGAGYTQYWYDRAGRLSFMQDENLREKGLYRFFLYDSAGRQAVQGVTSSCNRNEAVNTATFSGTGVNTGFAGSGYRLADESRIGTAKLERVDYYDSHNFTYPVDTRLVRVGHGVSTKGLKSGTVIYDSEGGKSICALYYDIRGNVIETREITAGGQLRVNAVSYNFSNQPITSTMTENGVTVKTDYGYDAASGLPVTTDVAVNGIGLEVSKVTYDNLGRVDGVRRGGDGARGGYLAYSYNLHGQTTMVTGPGFSQWLYYAEGPGTPRYDGKASAMSWTTGSDPVLRGYRYSYNRYGWLTLAEYGEGESLADNRNRYTEKLDEFTRNGIPCKIQRHGLKADGIYGKIDNLRATYFGNRITGVKEDAEPVTQPGSMDFTGTKGQYMAMDYNSSGSLIKDESRGITDIEYDNLGNPVKITYSNGNTTENVYSAAGEKLKSVHTTGMASAVMSDTGLSAIDLSAETFAGTETIEYRGPVIYRNGSVDMVLFDGGYCTIDVAGGVTFHYYTKDYLGNNRAVINGTTSELEQTVSYYPYGGVIADLGTGHGLQPYKFGGKELMTANGLNEYDFGARQYWHAVPGFNRIDPLCEKYYWLSPYLYCGNDPVNAVDPDGNLIIFVNGYIGFGSPPAGEPYWNGRKSSFVRGAMDFFNDRKINFIKYDKFKWNSSADSRNRDGYNFAKDNFNKITKNLEEGESIKFVTHSMGAAFGEGMAKFLTEKNVYIESMLHINPFQAADIKTLDNKNFNVKTIDYQCKEDPVIKYIPFLSSPGSIKGASSVIKVQTKLDNLFQVHREPIDHGTSFWNQLNELINNNR